MFPKQFDTNEQGQFIPNDDVLDVISTVVSRVASATSLAYYPLTNTQFLTIPMTEEQSRREDNLRSQEDQDMHPPDEELRITNPFRYK